MLTSSPSSTSSSSRWKYDVFLSFRGEDTRKGFTDHLYTRLQDHGINTFIDKENLQQGEYVSPKLLEAIRESWCSIIVFSKTYASSSWCLDELVEILKQKNESEHKVFPVFYHIDPSDLRKQTGKVKESFAKHEDRYNQDKTQSWRNALSEAAGISGWPIENSYESDFIKGIVKKISAKLVSTRLSVPNNLIGIHSCLDELCDKIKFREDDFRIVGICGMSGIGKTILAEVVYNQMSVGFEEIVKRISAELNQILSSGRSDLSGIDSRLDELLNKISLGKDDVRVVGICGMSGIGKTTLARVVYDQMCVDFEGKCFLECGPKYSKDFGLVPLQKQLLSATFPKQNFQFSNEYDGEDIISRRLRCKKVLLVIDDLDNRQQLDRLAKKRDWFGLGSRIIITTRDEHLLRAYDVDDVYKPAKLDDNESLRLFSLKAFKSDTPKNEFMSLSKSVVEYADGLPLALEVLGSYLHGRGAAQWESTLERLERDSEKEIHDCLRISFERLEERNRKIFLDIAHFFRGEDRDFVTCILDGCEYFPHIGLDDLIKQSLITVEGNKIGMHKLLQEMGKKVVRQKSLDEPGKRCRLSEEKDVYHVLTKNSATEAIEGMAIKRIARELDRIFTSNVDEAFSKMKKLRLLIVDDLLKSFNVTYLSSELRLFKWLGYPLKALPAGFQPETVVALILPNSCIEQLFEGDKSLDKLKVIDLHGSLKLIKTPNFQKAENLESLNLEGCTNLVDIRSCTACLPKLKLLNLRNCTSLESIPTFKGMKSLETLILSGCNNLQRFPVFASKMERLLELYLDGIGMEQLPPSVRRLSSLVFLGLKDCRNLVSLPMSLDGLECLKGLDLSGCSKVERLPDLSKTKNLENLNLEGCTSLVDIRLFTVSLPKLKLLNLKNCTSLTSLPTKFRMESLEILILSGCRNLQRFPEIDRKMECLLELCLDGIGIEELPSSVGHLSSLVLLGVKDCRNLVSLPSNINGLKCLKDLDLSGCSKLESLPDFGMTKNLKNLNLEGCTSLVDVHPSIVFLPKLKLLNLKNCTSLTSLPTNIGMKSLETLILSGCRNLQRFPEIAGKMECLKLCLDGIGIEELPSSVGRLSSLVFLDLKDCRNLVSLPSNINWMKCLKVLDLWGCSKLESLPDFRLAKNLESLNLGRHERQLSEVPSSPNSMALTLPCLSGLNFLTELNLSCRNLCEGALLSDICCLSLLETLTLSHNNFASLPASLYQLTRLHSLDLAGCNRVKSLPELPLSVTVVRLDGCASLETVPYPANSYNPSSGAHFYCVNCFKFAANDNTLRMLKGYLKAVANARRTFDIVIPGSKIFKWLGHQREECSVMISNLQKDIQWMGFALYCVLVPASNKDAWKEEKISCNIIIHFEGFECNIPTIEFLFNSKSGQISEDHLWLHYLPRDILDNSLKHKSGQYEILRSGDWIRSCIRIEILFDTLGFGSKVNKCGARLVCPSDLEDMDPTIEQPSTSTSPNFCHINEKLLTGRAKKRKRSNRLKSS